SIHVQPLQLEEHRIVCLIGGVAAEDAAGSNNSERRPPPLHGPDLDGRGLTPERQVLADVERIGRISRGGSGRDIKCVKVVERGFDLRSVFDRVTHRNEHVFYSLADEGNRVKTAACWRGSRQRYVDCVAFQGGRLGRRRVLRCQRLDPLLDLRAELINLAAKLGPLLCGNGAYALLFCAYKARLSPYVLVLERSQSLGGFYLPRLFQKLLFKCVELFVHKLQPVPFAGESPPDEGWARQLQASGNGPRVLKNPVATARSTERGPGTVHVATAGSTEDARRTEGAPRYMWPRQPRGSMQLRPGPCLLFR